MTLATLAKYRSQTNTKNGSKVVQEHVISWTAPLYASTPLCSKWTLPVFFFSPAFPLQRSRLSHLNRLCPTGYQSSRFEGWRFAPPNCASHQVIINLSRGMAPSNTCKAKVLKQFVLRSGKVYKLTLSCVNNKYQISIWNFRHKNKLIFFIVGGTSPEIGEWKVKPVADMRHQSWHPKKVEAGRVTSEKDNHP